VYVCVCQCVQYKQLLIFDLSTWHVGTR